MTSKIPDMRTDASSAVSSPRYESLDLWRGAACFLVLLNHSVWYQPVAGPSTALELINSVTAAIASRLWMGVPIFFVISGYCITATAISHSRGGKPVGQYFYKRVRRIFPPYWIVLFAYALLLGAVDLLLGGALTRAGDLLRPWWHSTWQWIGSVTLTEMWRWHIVGGQKALVLGHAWTLCYEEQFYAVTGALLLVGPNRYFRWATAVTILVAAVALVGTTRGWPLEGYFFDGSWLLFAMGILLFFVLNRPYRNGRLLAAAGMVATIALAASLGPADLLKSEKTTAQSFLVGAAFTLAALVLHRWDGQIADHPRLNGLRTCGLMCYSLYLVHLPVTRFVRAALELGGVDTAHLSPLLSIPPCVLISLWLSWRFHLLVERRFMSIRERPARSQVLVEAVTPSA